MKKLLPVDFSMAEAFLQALDPSGIFTFQTFADDKERPGARKLARVFHGKFCEHKQALANLNQQGAGVFVMVNEGDGIIKSGAKTCRKNENVTRIRAFYVDLDGAPIEPVLAADPPPDIIVETSPVRWHAYWLVEGCPIESFSSYQDALIGKFNSDPNVKEACRVMRLPGFDHHKTCTPFRSRLIKPLEAK